MTKADAHGWMPIATAPKDGTAVWIAHPGGFGIGYFADGVLREHDTWFVKAFVERKSSDQRWDSILGTNWLVNPTHWQPLPEPPIPSDLMDGQEPL